MILMEIIKQTKWENIKKSLENNYPETSDNIGSYEQVFSLLQKQAHIKTNFKICISENFDKDFDVKPYIDVCGKNGTLNKELSDFKCMNIDSESTYANSEVNYSLALTNWQEWLGMSIEEVTLPNYQNHEIVAHCLWEMTFYGYDPVTIKQHEDEINRRAEEVKNMTEEERKERLIPWEKVIEDIE